MITSLGEFVQRKATSHYSSLRVLIGSTKNPLSLLGLIACFLLAFSPLCGNDFSFDANEEELAEKDPVSFELFCETTTIQPGLPFWIALRMNIEEHWHSYWKHPGDIGMPTRVDWDLPPGFLISELEWPYPQRFEQEGFVAYGFEQSFTLLAKVTPPETLSLDGSLAIEASARWLVCSDTTCLPGESTASLPLLVAKGAPEIKEEHRHFFSDARSLLPSLPIRTEAHAREGYIDLLVDISADRTIASAYFCPAGKEMIDHKTMPVISRVENEPGRYTLSLKTSETMPPFLQGVLVLASEEGPEALTINLPIEEKNEAISAVAIDYTALLPSGGTPQAPVEFEGGIALAILFAFLGGIILNLMPCVLPVVSLKILSFIKLAGHSRKLIFKHGLAFSGGVLISFWILAGIMLALQAYGQSVGWGFQLQEPIFVGVLAALLLLLALNLFGVFEIGSSVTSWAGQISGGSQASGLWGSFFSGVLATAVATPCTGPFLGSAIGFAVTLPAVWALVIFTSLGLGMASPYLLLTAFPKLLHYMPKPGAWMGTFKEILGFIMLATVLWLVWVFGAQTNTASLFLLLIAFFFLSLGAWIYGRWGSVVCKRKTRAISAFFSLICLGTAAYAIFASTSPLLLSISDAEAAEIDQWEVYSPSRVAQLQAQGVPVLVDFTAKWCLICQANHLVLSIDSVEKEIEKRGVVRMKADWTKNDPVITKALKQFGRNGVPLYVLYGKDSTQDAMILPQVLTPDLVVDYLNQLDPPIAAQ